MSLYDLQETEKNMKKIFLLVVAAICCLTTTAQDKVELDVAADLVSHYIWRGQELGKVSVQPALDLSYKGFSFSAWSNIGLSRHEDTEEFDLTLAYSIAGFNVGLTDYWTSGGGDPRDRYFMYESHRTNHVFELNLGYDFGFASLQAYTNLMGNDGVNKKGNRAYSTYVEATVPFRLASCDWEAAAGCVPMATDYYATSGFAVTNLSVKATKDIKITDSFSIPIYAQLVGNPCDQRAYFLVGFTLKP